MVIGPIEPVINDRGSKIMRRRKRGGDRGAAGRRGREGEEGKRAKKPPKKIIPARDPKQCLKDCSCNS